MMPLKTHLRQQSSLAHDKLRQLTGWFGESNRARNLNRVDYT